MLRNPRDVTPKRLNDILEVLQQADYELGTAGWIQGLLQNAHGYCAVGAIEAVTPTAGSLNAKWWAKRYLEDAIGNNSIPLWNDDPDRTYEQVEKVFAKAIKLVKRDIAKEAKK